MLKTFFLNSTLADYGEEEFNYIQKFLLQQGILNTQGADYNDFIDLQVVQHSAGDMSVDVKIGTAVIDTTRSSVNFKVFVSNLALANLVITPNTSGLDRVDAVILKLSQTTELNALMSNVATLEVVPGDGATALSDGDIQTAIGATYDFIRLADVTVSDGETAILTADIADTRVRCYNTDATVPNPTIIKFRQLSADPSTPIEGEMWYNTTDNMLRYFDGALVINIQASVYTGGNGIDVTAGVVSVNLDTNSGLEINGGKLRKIVNIFGDGSDGDVVISVNTSLARDMYYNNLTINNGIILKPNGFRIYIKGILNCVGTGKITANGDDTYSTGTLPLQTAGATSPSANSANGNGGGNATKSLINISGKNGGGGGTYGSGHTSGGTGGAVSSTPLVYPYSANKFGNFYDIINGTLTVHSITPGAGSGGNGSTTGSSAWGVGGAGGRSGGCVFICAYNITNLNVEAIGQNGGNGTNGTNSSYGAGGGGGGAGGNGGLIFLIYSLKTTITTNVSGGIGGAYGTGTTSPAVYANGIVGENGNVGLVKEILVV